MEVYTNLEDLWVIIKRPRRRISKTTLAERRAHCVYSQREEWRTVNAQLAEMRHEIRRESLREQELAKESAPLKPISVAYKVITVFGETYISKEEAETLQAAGMKIYTEVTYG